jgi:hypothetical protein
MRTYVAGLFALAVCMLGLSACDGDKGFVTLPEQPPTITVQPSNTTVTLGQAASFTVVAEGENLTYRWTRDGAPIPGATASTYTITATTANSAGVYRVVVSNATRSTNSRDAVLTVTGAAAPPTIVSQPESTTVSAGARATLVVVASGTPPLTYQWYKNDVAILLDADAATYLLQAATVQDAGNYTVTITNAFGTVTSNVAVLTVGP